jgi:hypothetical protein
MVINLENIIGNYAKLVFELSMKNNEKFCDVIECFVPGSIPGLKSRVLKRVEEIVIEAKKN